MQFELKQKTWTKQGKSGKSMVRVRFGNRRIEMASSNLVRFMQNSGLIAKRKEKKQPLEYDSDIETIKTLIGQLSYGAKAKILDFIATDLAMANKKVTFEKTTNEELLWSAFVEEMKTQGFRLDPRLDNLLVNPKIRTKWKRFAESCDELINDFYKEIPQRNIRYKAYRVLLKLTISYLRKSRPVVNPSVVFSSYNSLSGIFDRAFPGYAESGFGGLVIDRYSLS